jgi:branched-chain amino acid transport system substrate-binding protein
MTEGRVPVKGRDVRLRRLGHLCRAGLITASVLAAATAFAACGDDSDDSAKSASAAPAAPADAKPATGTPVNVGIVNVEDTAASAGPAFRQGATAAIDYLNKEGGGLGGHKIVAKPCKTDGSPNGAIKCASKLIKDDVVAVYGGINDDGLDAAFPLYERAGVPYVSPWPSNVQSSINPVSIALQGGAAGLVASIAGYAKDKLKATKATVVTSEQTPPEVLKGLVTPTLERAGVKASYSLFAPTTTDFTAVMTKAVKSDPGIIIAVFDSDEQCVAGFKAHQQVAKDVPLVNIACSEQSVIDAAGAAADGLLFVGIFDSDFDLKTKDSDAFKYIMATYGKGVEAGTIAGMGAASVMTSARAVDAAKPSTVDADTVLKAFIDAKNVKAFMSDKLNCRESKALPGLCTTAARYYTVEGGKRKQVADWISAMPYLPKEAPGG